MYLFAGKMTQARAQEGKSTCKPFLKWAGGKTQLLSQFTQYFPQELVDGYLTRYIDPFVGGGAVFLHVLQHYNTTDAFLFDLNSELILVYRVVQQEPHALIECLRDHHTNYYERSPVERKRYFYEIRNRYNAQLPEVDYRTFSEQWIWRAAHMIFLNKTCFNGLFRVNSRGEFNVPFGRYKRPAILDAENLLSVSDVLQRATLHAGPFQTCERFVNEASFVYFDPPYRPLNTTSNFTAYSKHKFGDDEQVGLARFFAKLDHTYDARLMLSNSDPKVVDPDDDFFEELYAPFHIHRVYANRMINSDAKGRGKITELLITNY